MFPITSLLVVEQGANVLPTDMLTGHFFAKDDHGPVLFGNGHDLAVGKVHLHRPLGVAIDVVLVVLDPDIRGLRSDLVLQPRADKLSSKIKTLQIIFN